MYARGGVEYGIEEGRYLNAVYEVRSSFSVGCVLYRQAFSGYFLGTWFALVLMMIVAGLLRKHWYVVRERVPVVKTFCRGW